jgi:hypothetical protein
VRVCHGRRRFRRNRGQGAGITSCIALVTLRAVRFSAFAPEQPVTAMTEERAEGRERGDPRRNSPSVTCSAQGHPFASAVLLQKASAAEGAPAALTEASHVAALAPFSQQVK